MDLLALGVILDAKTSFELVAAMGVILDHVLQFIILILALRALHMVSANTKSCAEVRRHFVSNDIGPEKSVPRNPSIGESTTCSSQFLYLIVFL